MGCVTLITTWPLYGLIAVGYVSMTLNQMSLDAGALAATMATSTALDPIASVVLGLTLFEESIAASPVEVLVDPARPRRRRRGDGRARPGSSPAAVARERVA